MTPVVIKVAAKTAKVDARPVNPVKITPPDGARVVVAPAPGPRGQQGLPGRDGADITPEEKQEIVDDAAEDVLAELEPSINLVLRYHNIRSQGA